MSAELTDEALLDRLQRAAFTYLSENTSPHNGLVADTSRAGSPCSIAVVGFALSCYPVAVERNWMSRQAAAALGVWVVLLVISLYLAIMISKPDIEGLNYFADTLMFGGVLLVASRAYDVPRKLRVR